MGKYPAVELVRDTPLPPHLMNKLQLRLLTTPIVKSVVVVPARAEPGSSDQLAVMRQYTREIIPKFFLVYQTPSFPLEDLSF